MKSNRYIATADLHYHLKKGNEGRGLPVKVPINSGAFIDTPSGDCYELHPNSFNILDMNDGVSYDRFDGEEIKTMQEAQEIAEVLNSGEISPHSLGNHSDRMKAQQVA